MSPASLHLNVITIKEEDLKEAARYIQLTRRLAYFIHEQGISKKIGVPERSYRCLQALAKTPDSTGLDYVSPTIKLNGGDISNFLFSIITDSQAGFLETLINFNESTLGSPDLRWGLETLAKYLEIAKRTEGVIRRKFGPENKRMRTILEVLEKTNSQRKMDETRKCFQATISMWKYLTKVMGIKLKRTGAIARYCPPLAQVYQKFGPALCSSLGCTKVFQNENDSEIVGEILKELVTFSEEDAYIYTAALTSFTPIQEKKKCVEIVIPKEKPVEKPSVKEAESFSDYNPHALIKNKVHSRLSGDSRLRIEYFFEEVLNNPKYSQGLRNNLAGKIKNNNWYNPNMTDTEVRNYFDDLELEAVRATRKE
ncbi:hypothetical protein HYW76_02650 [Candidatus Pacearchaeota archaeon]|nr:hypothetical protein [Candidatus Pacearchaeota archaeon]